jgi:uncharacterized protein (TIGR02599 family)
MSRAAPIALTLRRPLFGSVESAFTLVEVLVSSVVLLLLLWVIFTVTASTGSIISRTSARIDAFAAARAAFDLLTQRLSQATLNTYYDYFDASGRAPGDPYYDPAPPATPPPFNPARYGRQSDLQFLVRPSTELVANGAVNTGYGQEVYFVSPADYSSQPGQLATSGLLNACSFFVQYGKDVGIRPAVLETAAQGSPAPYRWRYRLMAGLQPTESLSIFKSVYNSDLDWIGDIANAAPTSVSACVAPVADNIISLVIWPRLSQNDDPNGTQLTTPSSTSPYPFAYNSRASTTAAAAPTPNPGTINQLPPNVAVAMVAISEVSAARLGPAPGVSSDTLVGPPLTIENALSAKFANITLYAADLASIEAQLAAAGVQFQVFSTIVPMRESHWTTSNP